MSRRAGHGTRHALAAAARRHSRLAAVGADVWTGLPVRSNTVDVVLVAFAPRNPAEMSRVLQPDGRLLILAPAADHLRELLMHTSVGIDVHKRERLTRKFGYRFELEHRIRVTDRVHLRATSARRCIGWGRGHATTSRPVRLRR